MITEANWGATCVSPQWVLRGTASGCGLNNRNLYYAHCSGGRKSETKGGVFSLGPWVTFSGCKSQLSLCHSYILCVCVCVCVYAQRHTHASISLCVYRYMCVNRCGSRRPTSSVSLNLSLHPIFSNQVSHLARGSSIQLGSQEIKRSTRLCSPWCRGYRCIS